MATGDLIGTWFPSGYYGHFRSKTRNDILQEYRHEASPLPPNQFVQRVRKSPNTHQFSKHDNRHSFPTDASYFDTVKLLEVKRPSKGMGRRKGNVSIKAFNPELIAWMPHEGALTKEGSSVSLYRLDFQQGGAKSNEPIPQRLSPRIRKKMDEMEETDARLKWTSDYKTQYSHGQPNSKINTDMNTGKMYDGKDPTRSHQHLNKTGQLMKVVPPYLAHTKRRTKSAPPIRYNVGDCLVWNSFSTSAQLYSPFSLEQQRNKMKLKTQEQNDRPRPPNEKRSNSLLYTPRKTKIRPQQTTPVNSKAMTPAATDISSFTPIQHHTNPRNVESFSPQSELILSKPVVVVD